MCLTRRTSQLLKAKQLIHLCFLSFPLLELQVKSGSETAALCCIQESKQVQQKRPCPSIPFFLQVPALPDIVSETKICKICLKANDLTSRFPVPIIGQSPSVVGSANSPAFKAVDCGFLCPNSRVSGATFRLNTRPWASGKSPAIFCQD